MRNRIKAPFAEKTQLAGSGIAEAVGTLLMLMVAGRDPRLSEAGSHVWKRVGLLLDVLGRMESGWRTMAAPGSPQTIAPSWRPVLNGCRDAESVAALSRPAAGTLAASGTVVIVLLYRKSRYCA